MSKIQQLSPHLADLIAAGEVVERPASCAKELVENSIDAGSTQITVEIQNGGMTYLRVTDNGCGIPAEDVETAFLRHATSKLKTASDLESIKTLGFRGEALAAISAVSRMDILTKTADATFGTGLHLEGGVVTERSEAGCPQGTTMIVRDLFYNTPARMKFMKSDSAEASALISSMQKLALAHPEVSFRILKDGQLQFQTDGDGSLYSTIYGVLGKLTAKDMISVESRWDKYSLSGFVSKATASRGNRSTQIFFVNGRLVRSKSMTVALEEAYRNRIMVGRFPYCVLHLRMPEHLVDVNVHPAKVEVKFLNERDVFDTIRYGVEGALDKTTDRPEIKLPKEPAPASASGPSTPTDPNNRVRNVGALPLHSPRGDFYRNMTAEEYRAFAKVVSSAPSVTPSKTVKEQLFTPAPSPIPTPISAPAPAPSSKKAPERISIPGIAGVKGLSSLGIDSFDDSPSVSEDTGFDIGISDIDLSPIEAPEAETSIETASTAEPASKESLPDILQSEESLLPQEKPYRLVGEVLNTYIIVEQDRTLLLIDKHAAHERILFEKLRARQDPMMSQLLLTPILFTPEREEGAILLENAQTLSQLGFSLSDYGDGTLAINEIPDEIQSQDAEVTLNVLASQLMAGKRLDPSTLRDELLHTIACKAAIKGGQHNGGIELEVLVKEVLSREELKHCPHGRPICITMTASQLERQFKR